MYVRIRAKEKGYVLIRMYLLVFITSFFLISCSEPDQVYIAEELAVIEDIKIGIDALHQRCLKEEYFLIEVGAGSFGYKCEGPYPKKLSLTYENVLTNDISAEKGYPLVLVSLKLERHHWKSKELKDGRVVIKGPASLVVSEGKIQEGDFWMYQPLDGTLYFYRQGIQIKAGPLG